MKVKDLIRDTIWTPGTDYRPDEKPSVSVLLPTFRRGASGSFRKAVRSVLDQTLTDLELIIIDDASTDGTADQIAEFMLDDGRVSCLRHPRNIGLPAVSEYEAYVRARADYIAFAFDDDYFNLDALEKLLAHSVAKPNRVCYGHVWAHDLKNGAMAPQSHKLGLPLERANIHSWNAIPNCAVLLPRAVIERVGLYDPHIVMARICDWDLWRRIGERYLLEYVDVDVGEVTGAAMNDSLGRTYALVPSASEEWMRGDVRPLLPYQIPEIDVFAQRPGLSTRSKAVIGDLTDGHRTKRPWLGRTQNGNDDAIADKVAFVLISTHDASVSLCFDYLPLPMRQKVRVVLAAGGFALSELAYASCLIVVRHLTAYNEWIAAAKTIGIPIYYFLDDNLLELASREGYDLGEDFSIDRVRRKLRSFAGVLVSTETLAEYFRAHRLHANVSVLPICYARQPLSLPDTPKEAAFDLTIASLGGRHRLKELQETIFPAIRAAAGNDRQIHLVVGGCFPEDFKRVQESGIAGENIKLTLLPFDADLVRALMRVAEHRPDIVVHAPTTSINAIYKTLNIALCAYLLDALLLVADDPPFSSTNFDCGIKVAPPDEPRAWLRALEEIIEGRVDIQELKTRNARYCKAEFSGAENVKVLQTILAAAPAITPTLVESRLRDLYYLRPRAGLETHDTEALRSSLLELSAVRKRVRRTAYRRRRNADLWPHISPVFDDIRRHIVEQRLRPNGARLELSDAIQDKDYVEYPVRVTAGKIARVSCAFSSEGIHEGLVGLELVDSSGNIAFHAASELSSLPLRFPVDFDLGGLPVASDGIWRLRLFARSEWPVYVYELATYSRLSRRRSAIAAFAKIEQIAS